MPKIHAEVRKLRSSCDDDSRGVAARSVLRSDGARAEAFAERLRNPANVLTPTIALWEVYQWIKRERSEEEALQAVAAMKRTRILDLTEDLALTAADLSLAHGLAMADSMLLAAARSNDPELVTTDAGFEGIEGVTLFARKK